MNFINELINKKYNTNKGYFYFIEILKEKYPNFKINFANLGNLSIVEMSEEYFNQTGFVAEYVATRNEIKILKKIEKQNYTFTEEEIIESFVHELVHAITSKIESNVVFEGLNQRQLANGTSSYFIALNEGITQLITNDLLGKKSDAYPFETTIAEQLSLIIGKEKLFNIYSSNNVDNFINSLKNIDKDFDVRAFVVNVWASHMVINGMLENGAEEDKLRITNIQKQLLSLYLKSNNSSYQEFLNIMFDTTKAEEIVNPVALEGKILKRNINDVGFTNIDLLKEELGKQIVTKSREEQNMKLPTNHNKREELLGFGYNAAQEMARRIKSGKIISDVIDDNGERIIVTLTSRGSYGYQVFLQNASEPHYYAEGFNLIENLTKNTDCDGRALRYESAKSRVQRNLVGVFSEYILDYGFHSFYINQKFPQSKEIQISQRMSGYDHQDPVVLLSFLFDERKVSIVTDAQMVEIDGKPTIRIGLGKINDDGTIDYDLQYKMAMEAEMAKKFLKESSMDSDRLSSVMLESTKMAQSLFYDVYRSLNLPIIDGVVPNNLLAEQAIALLPESQGNSNKLD